MLETKHNCVECEASFVLVERFDGNGNTCVDCASKLRPSYFGECNECRRIIQVGEVLHLGWVKLCNPCAKKIARNGGAHYICDTVAR